MSRICKLISYQLVMLRSAVLRGACLGRVGTRSFHYTAIQRSTENLTKNTSTPVDPKISAIVDKISQLNLLETSQLVAELKTKLNIPDMTFPPAGSFAGVGSTGANSADAGAEDGANAADGAAAAEEKTVFNIKLDAFDTKSKAKIIKEVKGLLGLSLVEAKKFVEGAPKVLKENVAKDDAEKIKSTLEGLGAKISLE